MSNDVSTLENESAGSPAAPETAVELVDSDFNSQLLQSVQHCEFLLSAILLVLLLRFCFQIFNRFRAAGSSVDV